MVAVVAVEELSAKLSSVEIVSKGLVMTDAAIAEVKSALFAAINRIDLKTVRDETELSGIIRRSIRNYVFKATKKNPMIVPIVMVV